MNPNIIDRLRLRRAPGNTLTEYCVIFGLVVLIGIGGLTLLGSNMSTLLALFSGSTEQGTVPGGTPSDSPPSSSGGQSGGGNQSGSGGNSGGNGQNPPPSLPEGSGSVPPPRPGQVQVCASHLCVNIPEISPAHLDYSNAGKGPQVTMKLAQMIGQIAGQVSDGEDADPKLVSLLSQLANHGHLLGNSENQTVQSCPPGYACKGVTPNGVELLLNSVTINHKNFQKTAQQLQTYLKTHPDALPVSMQMLLKQATEQISDIGGAYKVPDQPANGWTLQYYAQVEPISIAAICKQAGDCTSQTVGSKPGGKTKSQKHSDSGKRQKSNRRA